MYRKFEKIRASGLKLIDINDLSILLNLNPASVRVVAYRLIKEGVLLRLRRDLYLLSGAEVSDFEIANRLLAPSYISFESALNYWGMTTQIPEIITSAARRSKEMIVLGKDFLYSFLPEKLFGLGVVREGLFFIAGPEKALGDTLYYASLGRRSITFDVLDLGKINRSKFLSLTKLLPPKAQKLRKRIFP